MFDIEKDKEDDIKKMIELLEQMDESGRILMQDRANTLLSYQKMKEAEKVG